MTNDDNNQKSIKIKPVPAPPPDPGRGSTPYQSPRGPGISVADFPAGGMVKPAEYEGGNK